LEEDLGSGGIDSVFSEEGVDHHPFKGVEGRQNFAVMEASSSLNEVGDGSAHHGGLDGDGRVVFSGGVLHVGPDPKGSFIIGTEIITGNHLDTVLVVVGLGGLAEFAVGPGDRCIVDIGATHANLIGLVEISTEVTRVNLDLLARRHLGLGLGSGDGVETSIELVQLSVNVLRDSDSLKSASALSFLTVSVNLG